MQNTLLLYVNNFINNNKFIREQIN